MLIFLQLRHAFLPHKGGLTNVCGAGKTNPGVQNKDLYRGYFILNLLRGVMCDISTVERPFKEPPYNTVLGKTTDIRQQVIVKHMEKFCIWIRRL